MKEIVLKNRRAIAQGSIRDVYRHPANARLLVKVVRLSTLDEKFGSGRRWFKSRKRRYVRSPLILSEMNIDNVVYGSTGDGDERFVLIDGIGHKKFIPLEVASRALNRWNSRRKIRNLRRRVASRGGLAGGAAGNLRGGDSALTEQAAF